MRPNVSTVFLRYVLRTVTGLLVLGLVFTALRTSMSSRGMPMSSLCVYGVYSWECNRIRGHTFAGVENLDEFPRLKAWFDRIEARPAVQVGLAVPKTQ